MWGKNIGRTAILLALLSGRALPAMSADYMPPPLFGGAGEVKVAPAEPASPSVDAVAPTSRPAVDPVVTAVPPVSEITKIPTSPPGVKGDIPLPPNVLDDPASSLEPRVSSGTKMPPPVPPLAPVAPTVQDLKTTDLLDRNADRTDPALTPQNKATPKKRESVITSSGVTPPDSLPAQPKGLARPIVDGPGVKNTAPKKDPPKKMSAPKPSSEPKQTDTTSDTVHTAPSQPDMALTDQTPDPKGTPRDVKLLDDALPEVVNKKDPLPPPVKPAKSVTKNGVKSPSPVVRKMIEQNPKVMVYSRDKDTGEFKRVENAEHRVIKNKGQQTTLSASKTMNVPPPALIDDVMDAQQIGGKKAPAPPALPRAGDKDTGNVTDLLGERLAPISEDDLNRAVMRVVPPPALVPPRTASAQVPLVAQPMLQDQKAADRTVTAAPTPLPTSRDDDPVLKFVSHTVDLTPAQHSQLDDLALAPLSKNQRSRVEIRAYASAIEGEQNSDRRIALARGLAVRDYLKSQGIDPSRITLKALGAPVDQTAPDHVELVIQ